MNNETKFIAVAGMLIGAVLISQSGITPFSTPQLATNIHGYHLQDETSLFSKPVYTAGDTITVGGGVLLNDNISKDRPNRYWYNIWYLPTGETEWICIDGNIDEETSPFLDECICEGWNIQDGREFSIESGFTSLNLQTVNVVTDENFEGDLRIDLRFQLITPPLLLYQEFTVGSDTALIKSPYTVKPITVEPENSYWNYHGIDKDATEERMNSFLNDLSPEDMTNFLNCECQYTTFRGAFMSEWLQLFTTQSECEQALAEAKADVRENLADKYSNENPVPGYETLTFLIALGIAFILWRRKV